MAVQTRPIIVQVVESFGGGVFQSVSQLCNSLAGEADFVIVHGIRAETPENFKASFPTGTRFIHLDMGRAINPQKDPARALALRKILLGLRPHAVHAHSSKAGALTRIALFGTGIPRFYSPRGYGFQMSSAPFTKRAVYWLAERALGFLPATTVACGYGELAPARWVSWRTVIIPNGIDPHQIPAANRRRPAVGQTLQVVSSGRISPQKNFPLFCAIARHFLGQPVHFTWVGGGEIPAGTEIPSNVTITGWLEHAAAQLELNKGHVYLHMSAWEGLSRIVLEAMGRGFPLILSDIPGNRELATPANGFLCHTLAQAIAAVTHFVENRSDVRTMGAASLAHLNAHYNWNNSLNQWRWLYRLNDKTMRISGN